MTGIILLGLGPGNPNHLTDEAVQVLASTPEVWLRTRQHPTVASLRPDLRVESFDELYADGDSYEQVYGAIVDRVVELGRREQGVVYAVPGHPYIAESTSPAVARRARQEGIPLRVVDGLSFLEPTFTALDLDPFPRASLADALALAQCHVPPFSPSQPVLIAQLYSRLLAGEVKAVLGENYPDTHPVRLVHGAGTDSVLVEDVLLYQIDRSEHIGALTTLWLPELDQGASLEAFRETVARLRAPDGCPWDREQTHLSLRAHLIEEAYEAVAAMDNEDSAGMREEFGDLLLQVMLNSQIAAESGGFTAYDVLRDINRKIIRRHPHVFGRETINSVEGVLANWERLKQGERGETSSPKGVLDGVPLALPALSQALAYQERAARVGFDWPEADGVLEKIREEIEEIRTAQGVEAEAAEIGDLLFALVNLARWKGVDAEAALRGCNRRFRSRFAHVEASARRLGKQVTAMSLNELESLWAAAKRELDG